MKTYIKPVMNSEVFVTNEYIGACYKTMNVACLNMNSVYGVYVDTNNNGQYDHGTDEKWTGSWDEKNDCYRTGDASGKNHNLTGLESLDDLTKVFIVTNVGSYNNPRYTAEEAYVLSGSFEDSPHFISVTEANHS